jgi:hypothetical protein
MVAEFTVATKFEGAEGAAPGAAGVVRFVAAVGLEIPFEFDAETL